jgi:hypothetical protein
MTGGGEKRRSEDFRCSVGVDLIIRDFLRHGKSPKKEEEVDDNG